MLGLYYRLNSDIKEIEVQYTIAYLFNVYSISLGIIALIDLINSAELRWFGHITRMSDDRYPSMAYEVKTQEKKNPDRSGKKEFKAF